MERLTPYFIFILLLPAEIIGGIITLIYYTVKGMNSITDIDGAVTGFKYGVQLQKDFWIFLKNYTTRLIHKVKSRF